MRETGEAVRDANVWYLIVRHSCHNSARQHALLVPLGTACSKPGLPTFYRRLRLLVPDCTWLSISCVSICHLSSLDLYLQQVVYHLFLFSKEGPNTFRRQKPFVYTVSQGYIRPLARLDLA